MDVPHAGHLKMLLNQIFMGTRKMKARTPNTIEYKSLDANAAANMNPRVAKNAAIADSRARVRRVI